MSLSWILRCFLISSAVWNRAGRPVSSWRKRTSCRRGGETWGPADRPRDLRAKPVARAAAPTQSGEVGGGKKSAPQTGTPPLGGGGDVGDQTGPPRNGG